MEELFNQMIVSELNVGMTPIISFIPIVLSMRSL